MPRPLDEVVEVRKHPDGGVVLHDLATDEPLIALDVFAALALADDLTMAAERPLRAVA